MTTISHILASFAPISLAEMSSVKLMNRIDTKYVVALSQLPAILEAATHDYYAQEIEGTRLAAYDTLYYDTPDLDMYTRHHNRQLVRQKIRVRQYIATNQYFLEIKRKNNRGRTKKKRIEVASDEQLHTSAEMQAFIAKKSRYTWDILTPQLQTIFQRITLVNKAKTERLTIDLDLQWYNHATQQQAAYPNLVIIELKRDGNTPSPMLRILRDMRIHPMKMSKYCIGTALTNPTAKYNRFKQKIRKIERIIL